MVKTEQSKHERWEHDFKDPDYMGFLSNKILSENEHMVSLMTDMKKRAIEMSPQTEFNIRSITRSILFAKKPDPPMDSPDFDPLLHEVCDNSRYMAEVHYPELYKLAVKSMRLHWNKDEIKYKETDRGFGNLPAPVVKTLENITAFFAGSEGVVLENSIASFSQEFVNYESKLFFGQQMTIETVHSLAYKELLEKLVSSEARIAELKRSLSDNPQIRAKAEWAMKYMNPDLDIAERLVAFAGVEGISFAGSFSYIFYVKNMFPKVCEPLTQLNELVLRDESLHFLYNCLLYTYMIKKISPQRIREILTSLVKLEYQFNESILPRDSAEVEGMQGMNIGLMNCYTEFIANTIWALLGMEGYLYPKSTVCPFPFMAQLGLSHINNFFEIRDNNYEQTKEMVANPVLQLFRMLGGNIDNTPSKVTEHSRARASVFLSADMNF